MFDKTGQKFHVVISVNPFEIVSKKFLNIRKARKEAERLAFEQSGIEYVVCSSDSSFECDSIVKTHYK
jgi:hypothetical protein